MFFSKSIPLEFSVPLSQDANNFLEKATMEFDAKQTDLENNWRFSTYTQWSYDPSLGLLKLEYSDGSSLLADGQLLGTFCVSDKTFEWAWNNSNFDIAIIKDSKNVKVVGEKLGITYLQVGMIPLPDEVFLSYVCAIGLKVSDSVGMFRGSEGDVHPMIMIKNLRWA